MTSELGDRSSEHRCTCPNGSYGVKHSTVCYEARLAESERLRSLANDACEGFKRRISHLEKTIKEMARDHREDMRTAAAEERRSIETGEPYGTY